MSLSTTGILGNISSITINTSGASSIVATISVSIGGVEIGSPKSITANATNYTFTPEDSASGEILISWNQTSSKALYIKSISIEYTNSTNIDDATLSTLSIDGEEIAGFDSATETYSYEVAYSDTNIPVVSATANSSQASVDITQATAVPGSATVVVTAEDNTTILTYKVVFVEVDINDGSKERPFTIQEAIDNQGESGSYWVIGYIVGAPISGSSLGSSNTAIAISDTNDTGSGWMPVQLPSGTVRDALNLINNPENLGKQVKVYGTLEAYFTVPGVKNVSDYEILTTVGVKNSETEGTIIATDGNNIIVKADQATTVYVYSVSGKLVATSQVTDGSVVIPAAKGVYVVKTNNKVAKVIL